MLVPEAPPGRELALATNNCMYCSPAVLPSSGLVFVASHN